jgi:membrane glycosyltransferase
MLSIPISVYSSRVSLGRLLRRAKLLRIPEESDPPDELRLTRIHASQAETVLGFVDAVVHPRVNAIACALSGPRVKCSARIEPRRHRAVVTAVKGGPRALTDADKVFFLTDCLALSQLHFQVWTSPAVHPEWFAATAPITATRTFPDVTSAAPSAAR